MNERNNEHNREIYYHLLDISNTKHIRDPLWNTIYLHTSLIPLLEHRAMQRLTNIKQLGPAFLVYPGTTHTRFVHSLGVYHIARLILLHLLLEPHFPHITLTQAKSFLAAALLHDIGHFPYTHSLKELPLPEHETLSALIIKNDLAPLLSKEGISPTLTAAIISPDTITADASDAHIQEIFSALLSGTLDPDKLDYLCRDAFFAGVPYGIQDVSNAIEQMRFSSQHTISFSSMLPVENILFSKYLMYASIYWHKKVRAATAMVKFSLYHALQDGLQPDALVSLDDNQFIHLCGSIDKAYMKPAQSVHQGIIFPMIWIADFDAKYETLTDLSLRSQLETEIASALSVPFAIIDVPERISFETTHTEDTVFSHSLVDAFVKHIRKIRIFVSPEQMPQQADTTKINKIIQAIFDKI